MALERRYRLLPYLYTAFHVAHKDGQPVMAPVFFADPKDESLRAEEQAFMLGTDLLIIPAFARILLYPKEFGKIYLWLKEIQKVNIRLN